MTSDSQTLAAENKAAAEEQTRSAPPSIEELKAREAARQAAWREQCMSIDFDFEARHLPTVAAAMARQDIRYYLCGVYIEPIPGGGVWLVATDGHRMIACRDDTGHCNRPTIFKPAPAMIAAARSGPGPLRKTPRVACKAGRLSVTGDVEEYRAGHAFEKYVAPGDPFIDGKFPDWRKAMPDPVAMKPGLSKWVNMHYITSFAALVAGRDARLGASAVMFFEEGDKILVQAFDKPYLFGIIMAMRSPGETPPAYLQTLHSFRSKPAG